MKAIPFKAQNVILGKDQEGVIPLPAHLNGGPLGEVTSCWELSEADLLLIQNTKRIYLTQVCYGAPPPPVALVVENPFIYPKGFKDGRKQV